MIEKIIGKKRPCKYCKQVHHNMPFTDCHNPDEETPDDLQEAYKRKFGY